MAPASPPRRPWRQVVARHPWLRYREVHHLQALPIAVVASIILEWGPWADEVSSRDLEGMVRQGGRRRANGHVHQSFNLRGLGGRLGELPVSPFWSFGQLTKRVAWELEEEAWPLSWTLTYGTQALSALNWPHAAFAFEPFPLARPLLEEGAVCLVVNDVTCRAAATFPAQ